MSQPAASPTADREVVIMREFDAPRELVFDAWTAPEHVARWFGPAGFTITTARMDVRTGGEWVYVMHGPDGTDWPNWIRYHEVVRPARLAYDHGAVVGEPPHFQVVTTFEPLPGNRTRLTMRSVFPTAAARDEVVQRYGAIEGGKQTLARLAAFVAERQDGGADPQVRIVRDFAAPRELVFRAWSSGEALKLWSAPHGCALTLAEVDFRVGGTLRTCLRIPDGSECWCRGTYLEIRAPERIAYTLANTDPQGGAIEPAAIGKASDWPRETVVSVDFAELPGGGTRLTLRQTVSAAIAERTGAAPSWRSMLDRLDEALREG